MYRWMLLIAGLLFFVAYAWGQDGAEGELARRADRVFQLQQEGRHEEASSAAKSMLEHIEGLFGPDHPNTALGLSLLAAQYMEQSKYSKAEPLLIRALRIQEAAPGGDDRRIISTLESLALTLQNQIKYAEAEPLYIRILRFNAASLGASHPAVATNLQNLASLYSDQKRYDEAELLYRDALKINELAFGADHSTVAQNLYELADVYRTQHQYAMAEPLLQRALNIVRIAYGPDHLETASGSMRLGQLYADKHLYRDAEPFFQEALRIYEKALGPDDPLVGEHLADLAYLYQQQGLWSKAESLLERALAIDEAVLGSIPPEANIERKLADWRAAEIHLQLAHIYAGQGKYKEAELGFLRAIRIYNTTLVEEFAWLQAKAQVLVQTAQLPLALMYLSRGNTAKAKPLLLDAISVYENEFGPDDLNIVGAVGILANLHESLEQYDQAEQLLLRALQIQENALGTDHPMLSGSFVSLAGVYLKWERYVEAEKSLGRALEVVEPSNQLALSNIYNLFGLLKVKQKHIHEAGVFFRRALAAVENNKASRHPRAASLYVNLAHQFAREGKLESALGQFRRGLALDTYVINDLLVLGSEREKYEVMRTYQASYYSALSFIHRHLSKDAIARAAGLNLVLDRKGLVLHNQKQYLETLSQNLSPEHRSNWNRLLEAKTWLRKLEMDPPADLAREELQKRRAVVVQDITELENDLASQGHHVAAIIRDQRVDLGAIASALPPRAVLLEFAKIKDYDWVNDRPSEKWRYLVFVLHPDRTTHLIDLGDGEILEQLVSQSLMLIRSGQGESRGEGEFETARSLYDILWKPLVGALGNAEIIILSPDGIMNLVPFAAIQTPEDRYLIEDQMVVTVTSGRDVAKSAGDVRAETDLVLLADPNFDLMSPSRETYPSDDASPSERPLLPNRKFAMLPGTKEELTDIPPMISGPRKTLLSRNTATEEAVITVDHPTVLHLATHGFFAEQEPALEERETVLIQGQYDSPMMRSGLALAGANHAEAANGPRDGLLTALEVTGMDLHGTDLVVLSACDTGIGEVRNGEGVYGLRRAFALAGAENLILSLWPIWDKQATKQMKSFYRYYAQGVHPAMALRKVQLERIQWMRKYMGTAPPSLWAPFMVQSTGSLDEFR